MTTMTATGLLGSLWRHKYITIAAVGLCSAAAVGGTLLRSPEYEARSSLLLRFDNNYYPKNPVAETWEGDPVRVELANAISTEIALLGSRSVLQEALNSVGGKDAWKAAEPTNEYRERLSVYVKPLLDGFNDEMAKLSIMPSTPEPDASEEQILNQIQEQISIKRTEGTSVATVEMRHSNRDFAVAFVNAIMTKYLALRSDLFPDVPLDKLAAQASEANRKLLVAEAEFAQMKMKLGVPDPNAEQSALLNEKARLQAGDLQGSTTLAALRRIKIQRDIQLKVVDKRLTQLSEADAALTPLKLVVEQARGDADRANRTYQKARLSEEAKASDFIRVVDSATSTVKPVGLSMTTSAVLGGLVGLALAIIFATLDALRKASKKLREQSYVAISEYGWFRPAIIVSLPQTLEPSIRSIQSEADQKET